MNTAKDLKYYSRRLRHELHERGLSRVGALIASNLAKKAFTTNKSTWYHLRLDQSIPVAEPRIQVSFGFLSIDEATSYLRLNHASFPWMFIEQELELARSAGHKFPCLRDDGRIIGYLKLGISKVFILDFERILHIPSTAILLYDGFISPPYRRMGLGAYIISKTARFAQDEGFRTAWAQIPSWNEASIRMVKPAGFKPVGEIRFIRVFGKEFFHMRPKAGPFWIDSARGKLEELEHGEAFGL